MIVLILINILIIVYVYLKYYKEPKNITGEIKSIEEQDSMVIGYINDVGLSSSFDLILSEIIELNIKGYITIEYNKENIEKYDYVIKQNIEKGLKELKKYEVIVLKFLFSNKQEITKKELEEKINNTFQVYNVQNNEIEKVLNEKLAEEDIIDLTKQNKLQKETKLCIIISCILVLLISILGAPAILDISPIYVLIYILEKVTLCTLLINANCYTYKGKILKYNIEKYKLKIENKEYLTTKNSMKEVVLNKEFANSMALHINTLAKETFINNEISKNNKELIKKVIRNFLVGFIIFVSVIVVLLTIMMGLSKNAKIMVYSIVAIATACVADITLLYKNKK